MAIVTIIERNGAGSGVDTSDPSHLNFGSVDMAELNPADAPIPVVVGTQYSYEKWLRLSVDLGDSTQVDNFRVWLDSGEYTEGEEILCNLSPSRTVYKPTTTYSAPLDTPERATIPIEKSQPYQANLGIGGSILGAFTVGGADTETDYCILQMKITREIGIDAPVDLTRKLFVFQYDEQ